MPLARTAMHEEAIGPSRAGHRREPVIANRKRLCQRMNHGQRIEREVAHDLRPFFGGAFGIALNEIRQKSTAVIADLAHDVDVFVVGINVN